MAKVIKFEKFEEYFSFNEDFLNTNPLLNFFLIETIKKVFQGKAPLYKFFNVTNENRYYVVVLLVEDACLLYADKFNDEMISLLSEELEFHKFKRYNFAGSKQLIDALFSLNKATYSLNKHRIIYKCQQVSPLFTYSPGQMQMSDLNRLNELTTFSVAFSKAYDNQDKTFEEMKQIVFSGIMNDNFYQWNYKNNICSVAQAIHGDYDFPVIGHLFTNPAFRNQGFGSSIVHRLTKGLLEAGNEVCMLVADATNPASNKAFIKVGYEKMGEYIRAYKER